MFKVCDRSCPEDDGWVPCTGSGTCLLHWQMRYIECSARGYCCECWWAAWVEHDSKSLGDTVTLWISQRISYASDIRHVWLERDRFAKRTIALPSHDIELLQLIGQHTHTDTDTNTNTNPNTNTNTNNNTNTNANADTEMLPHIQYKRKH